MASETTEYADGRSAATQGNKDAPTESNDSASLHADALKQYERGYNKDRLNKERAYDDLRFAAEDTAQWDALALQQRKDQGRPILTVNKTGQFIRQVTGDMRQMRPAIKCVKADDQANTEVAEKILPGMIRYIENRSDAQGAYFPAIDSQVIGNIGHWRIDTEYAASDTFNQEIRIAPVEDGIAVVWDADAVLPTRDDAQHCFVPMDMARATFQKKYPDATASEVTPAADCFTGWYSGDMVRVCEYWYKKPAKRTLALLPSGGIDDLTDAEPDAVEAAKAAGARIEKRDGFKVCRAVMTASEIIEGPDDWPGLHIPIVPVLGEEIKIGREIVRRGVVRALRDPQMLYNYAISTQAEIIALQPKAPFIGTQKQFQDHEDQWESANSKNWPYLEYTPDPAAPGPPQRAAPAQASQGLQELLNVSQADMNAVTGIYPAALGAQSNETSGKAILARQREGDTGIVVYKDNFGRALRHTGTIVLDLIPHIYDTQRMITIIGEDGSLEPMTINQSAFGPDGITETVLRDVTVGAYHLVMEMGPSYQTKREEARDGMTGMMQALGPQSSPLFVDLFAKMQDWPLADQIADRAHMMLPPQIQAAEAAKDGKPPPPQPAPPPPSPEQQAQMAQQAQEHQLNQAKLQLDSQKLQTEMAKINAELEMARMNHQATMVGHAVTARTAQPTPDQRVDDLAAAVVGLRDIVTEIAQALSSGGPPPTAPPNGGMPPINPGSAPPPGGVSVPGAPPPVQ